MYLHACREERDAASELIDSLMTSSDSGPELISQRGRCFLCRKLIQHFVRQVTLNSYQGFLIQLLPSFFLHVLRLFLSLPSSAFFKPPLGQNGVHPNLSLLKLMTLSNFWISNLIANIFTLTCSDTNYWKNNLYALILIVVPPWPIIGLAQRNQHRIDDNTQFNVDPPIKQIVCTSTGDVEKFY